MTPIIDRPLGQLAQFAAALRFEALAAPVVAQALLVIRDLLGATLAGTTAAELRGMQRLAATLGGPGRSAVIGTAVRRRAEIAAWVNATAAGTLELTEGNQFAMNHPGMHVLPAALAVAEEQESSGGELIAAFVAGYEIAARMGRATQLAGAVHPFGTTAIVGVAAAAARLRGLAVPQITAAMELAAGMAVASSQAAANSGASVRNVAIGLANQNGILATGLVEAGFTGEPGAFGSVFGRILGQRFDANEAFLGLGTEFLILKNYFKVYACSRWNHAPIEATIAALEGRTLALADIERVTVWTFDPATRLDGREPPNGYAAKHSIPYNVAVRIAADTNGVEAYSDRYVLDPDIRALARRISVHEDPDFTASSPRLRPARVEIRMRGGTVHQATVERPAGGFDNPFPRDVLDRKFRALAGMALDGPRVEALEANIWRLPELVDVGALGHAAPET